ncbi:hypothetical protein MUN81_15375 [Hymenobacter sp. 5317J-9]|uniref:hypothetical protein n=1 Tax=Hymenobacter sp. 5317J-9 TaxID=2932250 RepID=UPI001FD6557F|nr:hypothetical protein [Hymenobacter sp. 5317J-9]UOQ96616.1 hypothetical protein MUN81_15375 [Hymenobacter sp. 5317J-9]
MSAGARIALALLGLMLALCVYSCMAPRFQEAPRQSRRYYQHRQRVHAQERRHHYHRK